MDKTSHQNQWDEIAWNGIAFYKPATWEIATIGRNYMMIGTHAHPRMEITWGSTQKPVLRRQDIKKLQSRIRKQHLTSVDSWTPSGAGFRLYHPMKPAVFPGKLQKGQDMV